MVDATSGKGDILRVMRSTNTRILLVVLVLGATIGAAATYYMTSSRGVPAIVQGTVSAVAADSDNGDVTAIGFGFDGRDYATPTGA